MNKTVNKWIGEIKKSERLVFLSSTNTAIKEWFHDIIISDYMSYLYVAKDVIKKWIGEINPSERPIFVSVMILGILTSLGSVTKGYSIAGSVLFGILRSIFECILIYIALIRKSTESLIAVLGLWLWSAWLGVYFVLSGKADTIIEQFGLVMMAIIYFGLCLGVIHFYKNRKRHNHSSGVNGTKSRVL